MVRQRKGDSTMSAQLVPFDTNLADPIAIQQPVLLVGRHPEADVRLGSPMVSRRHCCLAVVYDKVLIRDLGSRHGVYVNGTRVEEAQIHQGDEVAIAHLIYRFEAIKPLPPALAPKPLEFPDPVAEILDDEDDLVELED